MNNKELVWHDYAEEEPTQGGSYLTVAIVGTTSNNKEFVNQSVAHFSMETGDFNVPNVLYWAELVYPNGIDPDSYYMDRDDNLNHPPKAFINEGVR